MLSYMSFSLQVLPFHLLPSPCARYCKLYRGDNREKKTWIYLFCCFSESSQPTPTSKGSETQDFSISLLINSKELSAATSWATVSLFTLSATPFRKRIRYHFLRNRSCRSLASSMTTLVIREIHLGEYFLSLQDIS